MSVTDVHDSLRCAESSSDTLLFFSCEFILLFIYVFTHNFQFLFIYFTSIIFWLNFVYW